MRYEIVIKKSVDKFLKKLAKSAPRDFDRINYFLQNILLTNDNPCKLPNSKHLQGFNDNRYRWRIGDYRIVGIVKNGGLKVVEIIKIDKRDDSTYKGL